MTFTEEQKKEIYNQINEFNKQPSNPALANSAPFEKAYLYVDEATAKDRAKFIGYLIEKKFITPPNKVIDLAFGSGSLTSHIILDNALNIDEVVFNDKNKDNTNQEISRGGLSSVGKVTSEDFLVALNFTEKYDWVVFNPQVGGGYTLGESHLEKDLNFEITDSYRENRDIEESDIREFLINEKDVDFDFNCHIDKANRRINITSKSATKSAMTVKLGSLKHLNYFDIYFKGKSGTVTHNESKVVQFRKNLDAIVDNDNTVIFLGNKQHFDILFADYPNVYRYMADGNELFVAKKSGEAITTCFELVDGQFVENESGQKSGSGNSELGSLEEVMSGLNQSLKGVQEYAQQNPFGKLGETNSELSSSQDKTSNTDKSIQEVPLKTQPDKEHDYDKSFYKNILLKGVPGTGKSRLLEQIIKSKLNISESDKEHHVLRVNIHSASSNADLMQGIAVSTNDDGVINYQEKRGLIFDLISRACQYPNQPFVLVLEEIQENSLNELIGDLIYLIEPEKRANLSVFAESLTGKDFLDLIDQYVKKEPNMQYVKIPNLVSSEKYRKMILPANLYVFCTSNYRDDKKIIEDNLLRRFEVIDLYPQPEAVKNRSASGVSLFLEHLNDRIIDVLKHEIHPDRFQIGHAIWLNINDESSFAKALYKTLIELKEIREIQPSDLVQIFSSVKGFNSPEGDCAPFIAEVLSSLDPSNLIEMIKSLQSTAYRDLMSLIDEKFENVDDDSGTDVDEEAGVEANFEVNE
ncbi:AAA family ATPase [Vibrio parahaemolyticus]|uniref:AAA family ATPase n=6 Tax=Vibrio parahaemolyticus TaxID=670 RepID=UPI00329A482D